MRKKKVPIGVSDFKRIITDNGYFVDKSLFIKDVVEGSMVLLFARPRRFGKSLNLNMLSYFYDCREDNAELFANLKISSETEIMQAQGKHPVMFISLKDVKGASWEHCYKRLSQTISRLVSEYEYVLSCEDIGTIDKASLQRMISETADITDYEDSIKSLSHAIYHHYKLKPVLLIDEYDTPIHEGYFNGYYKEIIGFMRNFLSIPLKDCDYIEKAVLTGILRVSRESMFSGLNNLKVGSISEEIAADKFGFNEAEVVEMLNYYDNAFSLAEIKHWYDGYNFCGAEIYNPWSIISCIEAKKLAVHWVNTSGNDLIRSLCQKADKSVKQELEIISQGGSIQKEIIDNIVFADIENNPNAMWSLFVHSGYLRYDKVPGGKKLLSILADLRAPNMELLGLFQEDIVTNWFTPPEKSPELLQFINNLFSGDIEVFLQEFIQFCQGSLSYFDVDSEEPENTYHMFVLGMLSCLQGQYHIVSNREAGLGRSDVMVIPLPNAQTQRGVIFEFKRVETEKKETLERAMERAKRQIIEKKYSQELQVYKLNEIVCIAVVFAGKDMKVEVVE